MFRKLFPYVVASVLIVSGIACGGGSSTASTPEDAAAMQNAKQRANATLEKAKADEEAGKKLTRKQEVMLQKAGGGK